MYKFWTYTNQVFIKSNQIESNRIFYLKRIEFESKFLGFVLKASLKVFSTFQIF